MSANVKETVRGYILKEFLPGEEPESLADDTPLITGGILNSISTVKMVTYLEQEFGVEFASHELGEDYLNTVNDICSLVESKQSA